MKLSKSIIYSSVVYLSLTCAIESADTHNWNGSVNSSMANPANWNIPPSSGSTIIFPSNATNCTPNNDIGAGFALTSIQFTNPTTLGNYMLLGSSFDLGTIATNGTSTVTIASDITVSSALTILANTDLMISGSISGAGGLEVSGSALLTLAGTNTYEGGIGSRGNIEGSTDSLKGNINSDNLTFNQANDGTYAGVLNAARVVTKEGSGTVTFTASDNRAANGFQINEGKLALSGAGSLNPLSPLGVADGAEFDISATTSGATLGYINGDGTIHKGSKPLIIKGGDFGGVIDGTGSATIEGDLSIRGTINGGVIIANNGILYGSGNLTDSVVVNSGGGIAGRSLGDYFIKSMTKPSAPAGPLNVGSLDLQSNSTFVAVITPNQAFPIIVTGTAGVNIASGVNMFVYESLNPGDYQIGTQYAVIVNTGGGTITGGNNFTVTSYSGFIYSLALASGDTTLFLILESTGSKVVSLIVPTAELTGNNLAIGNYLNSLTGYVPLQPVLTDLNNLSSEQLNQALKSISPARNAFSTFSLQNTAFTFSDTLTSRQNDQRFLRQSIAEKGSQVAALLAGPIMNQASQSQDTTYSVWASAIGSFAHEHAQKETPAFNMDTGGLLLGYDNYRYQNLLLGAAVGYAYVDIHDKGHYGKQYISDYTTSFYSTLYVNNCFFDFALWGGYHSGKSQRDITFPGFDETAKANIKGWQIVPHFLFGYDYKASKCTLEPFVQFDWAVNFERSFKEKGAGVLNMHQKAHNSSLLRSEIGLSCFQMHVGSKDNHLVVREQLSYVNKKMFKTGQVQAAIVGAPGGTFVVESLTKTQNLIAPGLEIFYHTRHKSSISLTYEGEFGSGYRANNITLKFAKDF